MRHLSHFAVPLLVVALVVGRVSTTLGQTATFCAAGQAPQFLLGFAVVKSQLGALVGEPLECEHYDAQGNSYQKTTTGQLVWNKSTNTATFRPAVPKVEVMAQKQANPNPIIITPKATSEVITVLTPDQATLLANLPSKGPAPELNNQVWLNSAPLKLADLRGKVVMVEFWTFACINCQHVTPSLKALYAKYANKGLVIIGVHSPEFGYEKELTNVRAAISEVGIEYPVAIDNNYVTWNAYNNHYWPARYLIDKAGNLRLLQIGEGGYAKTEATIQALLAEQNPS